MSAATARAIQASRAQLVRDLEELLQDGKRRFADVSWKVEELEDEVYYGHRGAQLCTSLSVNMRSSND